MSQAGSASNSNSSVSSTFTTDSGVAVPSVGNINILGGNNVITSGAGSTVLIDVNGTTNHAPLIGNSSGSISSVGPLTAGQILIGTSASSDPVAATLTAGSNITITNASGSITISSTGGGSGSVNSVSGTSDRITSTGGANPVIDIASTYVGQTSLTTLGTVSTGTWNATAIDATHGGTAQTSWTAGDLLYASASNTLSKLAAGTNTHVLTMAAGLPSWAAPAAGGVSSVTGTANQVTASPTTGAVVLTLPSAITTPGSLTTTTTLTATTLFTASAGQVVKVTTPGAYAYTTLATDYVILVDTSAARTINLIGSPTTGQTYRIKDNVGTASQFPITITPAAGNIDGSSSLIINTNWGCVDVVYQGSKWIVL